MTGAHRKEAGRSRRAMLAAAPGAAQTFRSLNRRGRILSTSQSVRFAVTASGRITGAPTHRAPA